MSTQTGDMDGFRHGVDLAYRGLNSIERRLEVIEGDLKQFYRGLAAMDKRER